MGFLNKLKEDKQPKKVSEKEKKVATPSKKQTILEKIEEVTGTQLPIEAKTPGMVVKPEPEKEAKTEPAPLDTDKTNYGGIGIVGEHVEISKFKALVKFHGKGKVNRSIGRVLVEVLREYNEKNKM